MRLHLPSALVALAFAATSATAVAQTNPAPSAAPHGPRAMHRMPSARLPLMMAYRTLGIAEAFGASGHYLDAARDHYRSALARLGRNDEAGAGAEARLAADLARVALAEHPMPAPHDLPSPPPPATPPHAMAMGPAPGGPQAGGWGGHRGGQGGGQHQGGHRGGFGRHGVSLAEIGMLLKVENTPEAHALADAAFAADQAAAKAAFAGDLRQSARQHRIAGALGAAVRDLAQLDHPELRHRPGFGPGVHRGGPGGPGGPGALGAPGTDG
jgi:hypothetical protein